MSHTIEQYDEVTYPNYVFAETHPTRLAANGKIFGLDCPSPQNCRVLDIGCAGGLNLLSHATSLPDATFIGIDASEKQIQAANELKALCGVKNVEFHFLRLEDLPKDFGNFDYIICHGVFAWVPKNIQEEILKVCKERLSAQGVAYVSYNALPGWHIHTIIRDALCFHTKELTSSLEKIKAARQFLEMADTLFPDNAQPLLHPIVEHLQQTPDNYLIHDHLGEENHPLYFHEFTERCQQLGLMYLAESDLASMIPKEFPLPVQEEIRTIAQNSLSRMEQYCDFFRLRPFRKTLICRDDCKVQRAVTPLQLRGLSVTGKKIPNNPNYICQEISDPAIAALISERFPQSLALNELLQGHSADRCEELLNITFRAVFSGEIDVVDSVAPPLRKLIEMTVSPLAKALVSFGDVVPNLRSDAVKLDLQMIEAIKNNSLNDAQRLTLHKFGLLV